MSGTLPTDDKIELLVCEDVRQEVYGKFTLGGFFPGREVNVQQVGLSVGAIQLTFFFMIHGPDYGDYNTTFNMVPPSSLTSAGLPQLSFILKKEANRGAVQIVKMPVFIPTEIGDWKVILTLDGKDFVKTFRVTANPSLIPTV
jgi:hypothetical protein